MDDALTYLTEKNEVWNVFCTLLQLYFAKREGLNSQYS